MKIFIGLQTKKGTRISKVNFENKLNAKVMMMGILISFLKVLEKEDILDCLAAAETQINLE